MERLANLSPGTKLMLASATLLFLDLFLTWQRLPQSFGRRFEVTENLDAWDGWGLLLGLATLALLGLLILRETSLELSRDVSWNGITLGLAISMLCLVVLKNILDAHSAWASYAGIALAAVCAVGAYLDREREEPERERPFAQTWKPRVRATSTSAQASEQGSEEPRTAESSARW